MADFEEFPKIARLSRECVITEKIDGTNAQVLIAKETDDLAVNRLLLAHRDGLMMLAGSRTQYITPERDNHGFARWVQANADALWALGEGRHFGEWWGSGIQRGYGLTKGDKRFSLFNVARWADDEDRDCVKYPTGRPSCCHVVPMISRADFTTETVDQAMRLLAASGSIAAPGYRHPEGIVVWHEAARLMFKKTLERDEEHKFQRRSGLQQAVPAVVTQG